MDRSPADLCLYVPLIWRTTTACTIRNGSAARIRTSERLVPEQIDCSNVHAITTFPHRSGQKSLEEPHMDILLVSFDELIQQIHHLSCAENTSVGNEKSGESKRMNVGRNDGSLNQGFSLDWYPNRIAILRPERMPISNKSYSSENEKVSMKCQTTPLESSFGKLRSRRW